MKMKIQRRYVYLLFSLLAVVLLLPGQVRAQEASCTVSIPVETVVSGDSAPSGTEFEIALEAIDAGSPMPEKASVMLKDSGTMNLGPITYTVPEDYQYRVYQIAKNVKNYTYDKTVYTVTVRVLCAEDGRLSAMIWAIKDGSSNKTDRIVFQNCYKSPTVPARSKVKTGDTGAICVWAGLLAAALAAVILASARRGRQAKRT